MNTNTNTNANANTNTNTNKSSASQEFLDSQQYAIQSVLRYERIFGEHFVSTGGLETTAHFTSLLDLSRGQKVLDVGCGIGGSAFHLAKTYEVNVHGIDLSTNMVHIAQEKCKAMTFPKDVTVTFEICDATTKEYPENSFDVIYSRDAILHIYDKLTLFRQFYKWLKPGGKVFITDYCWGSRPHSKQFTSYVKDRGYHLLTVTEYGKILEWAGLINVVARDVTVEFMQVLRRELKQFTSEEQKKKFLKDFSREDYKHIIEGWESKVERCADGDQRWGAFYCEKPCRTYLNIMARM